MAEFITNGGYPLKGEITISGAKNMVLPAMVAGLLTNEEVILENVPLISDLNLMIAISRDLGAEIDLDKKNHTLSLKTTNFKKTKISLEIAARLRTSFLMLIPLLIHLGKAAIPNPGGCRIGARPILRAIEGLKNLGVKINYDSSDGYFHAKIDKLTGGKYFFQKNTHTGTEMLILAAVLASGQTVLENAAQEPEIDDLINLLNQMGAKIKRVKPRTIVIDGVTKLHGTSYKIMEDRNEAITLAVAALITKGDILIKNCRTENLRAFLEKVDRAGGGWKKENSDIRFFYQKPLIAVDITTGFYPGFMTDWQAPFAVLMTQASGESTIHETIYENRFQYVNQLVKMGAKITLFKPEVENPEEVYNFDLQDDCENFYHGIKIVGSTILHNAVLEIPDLRAGATLVLAALAAKGESFLTGIEHLNRGYEDFAGRLNKLGAKIEVTLHR